MKKSNYICGCGRDPASTRVFSRVFQILSSSADGAVPMRPGWIRPGKRTPDTHSEM